MYTVISSLLTEKPFSLLRPQCFSFQIVSEFIGMCEIFELYVPRVGHLTPCSVPKGGFLYTMIVPGGGLLLSLSRVPGRGEEVLDGIDTCINIVLCHQFIHSYSCPLVAFELVKDDLYHPRTTIKIKIHLK